MSLTAEDEALLNHIDDLAPVERRMLEHAWDRDPDHFQPTSFWNIPFRIALMIFLVSSVSAAIWRPEMRMLANIAAGLVWCIAIIVQICEAMSRSEIKRLYAEPVERLELLKRYYVIALVPRQLGLAIFMLAYQATLIVALAAAGYTVTSIAFTTSAVCAYMSDMRMQNILRDNLSEVAVTYFKHEAVPPVGSRVEI